MFLINDYNCIYQTLYYFTDDYTGDETFNLFDHHFKSGTRGQRLLAPGFLKLLWSACRYACVHVCVSVCPPPRPLITSGVIWCDIGCVRLVKQVLRLFPAFNYFIWHFPSIKWMGVAILTQHVMNACLKNQGDMVLATKGLPKRRSVSFTKVSVRMHNNAFKRRPTFSFTVIISA